MAAESATDGLATVTQTVRRLVSEQGCAWHGVQTHESLIPYLIEEAAEFVDAIEREQSAAEIAGELGDVLYQVLFHAAIAERDGEGYDLQTVASALNEKLIARHPHVFGDRGYMSVEELNAEWERLKEDAAGQRRGSRGALEGIPTGMPTLARAAKVIERLKRASLLDVHTDAAAAHVLQKGSTASDTRDAGGEDALGDSILALVIEANARGIDADRALRLATARLADARQNVNTDVDTDVDVEE